jgi:chitodextrinase
VTVTTTSPPRTLTFTPAADATIVAASPSANFGTAMTLEADASPMKAFLLRFNVSGVGAGTVTGAKLRLHVTNGSDRGGDIRTTAGTWTESAVTWSSAPPGGAVAASIGAVPGGSTQEVALSPQSVPGDGAVNFRVDSPSGDGAAYDSREALVAVRPQLVLTIADQSTPDTGPPTAPTGLSATVVSNSRIDLAWSGSTDDKRVAGYRVFRNGAELATTTDTSYSDTAVLPSTNYSYHVVAYDTAGNVSPPSNTANAATPAGARTLTFAPTADATILRDTPTVNSGAARDLQADSSPIKAFLLKFDVSGIGTGTVTSVKLRLHVVNPSPRGGDFARAATTWSENTVTWSTAPAAGVRLASLGSVATGSSQEVLLPDAITADGTFGLRVDSSSSDGVAYDSREAGTTLAPQLLVTVSGGASPFAVHWLSNGS